MNEFSQGSSDSRAQRWRLVVALVVPLLLGLPAAGLESPGEQASPTNVLSQLVGGWNITGEVSGGASSAIGFPAVSEGTARRKLILGGAVLQEEVMGAPGEGGVFHGHGLIGYDEATGKYWRTWVDSQSSRVSVLHGSHAGDTIVFRGESTDMKTGETQAVLSVVHLVTSTAQEVDCFVTAGGKETKVLRLVYEGGPEECTSGTGGSCNVSADCCTAGDLCTNSVCG